MPGNYLRSFGHANANDDEATQLSLFATGATGDTDAVLKSPEPIGRQAQIMELVAAGFSDKEIGKQLGISHRTVRTHLEKYFRKHGQNRRTAAVAFWVGQRTDRRN